MVTRRQIGPCSMPGCGTPIYSGYLCEKHDIRRRRHGDPTVTLRPRNSPEMPCAVPGCTHLTTRTYCVAHEKRLKRYGSVEATPPRGRRSFQGPCSEFGCGNIATQTGRCARHSKALASRPMLTAADVATIRANADGLDAQLLAERFNTTPRTIVAVKGGRDWGFLRD
jgi:hypothetical protein